MLFILYINDIKSQLESELLIFADDTTLIAPGAIPGETSAKINRDLERIEHWASTWKVTFNGIKSKEMLFSKKDCGYQPQIMFCGDKVERVKVHRHLWLYLTPTLDWFAHVHQVCLRAIRKLAVLRNI